MTLRNISSLGTIAALLLFVTLSSQAAATRHETGAAATGVNDGDHTELEEAMEVMEDELRVLRKSLKDQTKQATSLKSIVAMQDAVSKAKVQTPPMAESQPAEKRADFVKEYRRMLIRMGKQLLDLEELVLDGKTEEAGVLFKEIRNMEDSGHERFTDDG